MDVCLRRLTGADTGRIAGLINNKRIWDNLRDFIPYPYSVSDAEDYLEMIAGDVSQVVYGVECEDELVGVAGLVLQQDVYRYSAEIGYWLGEEYWGRGIMTRAVGQITDIGFSEYNLLRIYAGVIESNTASMRVLEKAGFRFEGVLKKAMVKNGVIADEYRYALLNEDLSIDLSAV